MESYIFKDAVSTLSYKALNQTPSVLPGVVAMELGGKTDDPGASLIFLIVQVESVLFFFFFLSPTQLLIMWLLIRNY